MALLVALPVALLIPVVQGAMVLEVLRPVPEGLEGWVQLRGREEVVGLLGLQELSQGLVEDRELKVLWVLRVAVRARRLRQRSSFRFSLR